MPVSGHKNDRALQRAVIDNLIIVSVAVIFYTGYPAVRAGQSACLNCNIECCLFHAVCLTQSRKILVSGALS